MNTKYPIFIFSAALTALALPANAQDMSAFTTGPVFEEYGPNALVETDFEIPEGAEFKVAFDVAAGAETGELNRTLQSAARFMNMHVRAGVPLENIHAAVVVHGKASEDLLGAEEYADRREGAENANIALIAVLADKGMRVILCGQSAAAYGISNDMLAPGVEMALSAMTAHALLQQDGYTVNPF
ncbi:DsrE family protein [Altererythrobacter sp.]|uniref:DsrE family protein n=1 Tax=Altererythrobacter sp. TaxID=1872480 RepID=UPI001B0A55D8|nr:DsrE family protein [Altererythrobacter sp.]MBO6610085.1 DsrE family protein [Altererythrobacter sp.]MBO6642711.1 DsrE family protein [Altererythrobacter sp.]MBO6708781.1 DsrE family protein [Altererythrobacter sp.]